MKGFKAYQVDTACGALPVTSRRDYYTIYLLAGQLHFQGAGQEFVLDGSHVLLVNPSAVPASEWKHTGRTGFACLFTTAFVSGSSSGGKELLPLFNKARSRVFSLCENQAVYLTGLFQKMVAEQQSAYLFKHELLRNYLQLVLHEAVRLRPVVPNLPSRRFRYYFRRPDLAGVLGSGRRRRRM